MIDERPTVSQLEDYQATNNIKNDIVEFAELRKKAQEGLNIVQVIDIVNKINNELQDCDDLSALYHVGLTVIPIPDDFISNPYIAIDFPFEGNTVWDSENDEHTEEAIKEAVFHELKTIYYNFHLMAKHLNLCNGEENNE